MKRLWTPWRMKYLKENKGEPGGCIFCSKLRDGVEKDHDNLVLLRGERAFAMLNLYPYANGHMMVAPYEHTGELESLDSETLKEMMSLVSKGICALRHVSNPQGFNVGVNEGSAAGAGVADHVHIHIVPRWRGDTNFMGVVAETRMIPELLPQTYDSLIAAFKAEDAATARRKSKKPLTTRRRKIERQVK